MPDFETVSANLRAKGYTVSCFDTAEEAAAYLDGEIDGVSAGFGGSVTLREMGLYERLKSHNRVFWHWAGEDCPGQDARTAAAGAEVYLTSVNALAETGEIVNIDGVGNRVSAELYGHKKVYLVAGENKLAEDFDAALFRARNVASPKNARRLGKKTPCAAKGDRCYDCKSPERICRALAVLWCAPDGCAYEVVLIRENLGY